MTEKKSTVKPVFGQTLASPIGRCQYVYLTKARADDYGNSKYSITVMWPKKDADLTAPMNAMTDAAAEVWAKRWGNGKKYPKDFLVDGDKPLFKKDSDEPRKVWSGFKGHWYRQFVIKDANKPRIFNAKKEIVQPELIHPGMFVRAVYTVGCAATGIFTQLKAVQLIKDDGTRFWGVDPAELLEVMPDDSVCGDEGSPDMSVEEAAQHI